MRKLFLAAVVALTFTLPAQAHTTAELEQWYADWLATPQTSDVKLAELQDMQGRHPCFPQACEVRISSSPAPASVPIPPPTVWGADAQEALVYSLVQTYFQPGDWDQAMRVARCESGFSPTAKNSSSSAAGVWQFLRSTWDKMVAPNTGSPSYDAGGPYDPTWATINAAWLWYNVGPTQWSCY